MKKEQLKENYNKAVNDYIAAFEKKHDAEVTAAVSDEVGGIYTFSDLFFHFSDIKYATDENIDFDTLLNWDEYYLENYKTKPINLKTYNKLFIHEKYRHGFSFNFENFHKFLKEEFGISK